MLIKVTEADIKLGRVQDIYACPVALALKRTTQARHVASACTFCFIDDVSYDLPLAVTRFVTAYDKGKKGNAIKPFEFELEIS